MNHFRCTIVAIYTLALAMGARAWNGSHASPPQRRQATESTNPRRSFLQNTVGTVIATVVPSVCHAGEIGERITQTVTTSDIGVSVRRSVVRGAQVMDSLDLKAERFSDRMGLGSERASRPGKPKPKTMPDPNPLDAAFVTQLINDADSVFCDITKIGRNELQSRVRNVADSVRPSFVRSGLKLSPSEALETAPDFNFASYIHYKAYCDLLVDKNVNFKPFKKDFESRLGRLVASTLVPDWVVEESARQRSTRTPEMNRVSLSLALERIKTLTDALVDKGLLASVELAPLDSDDIIDWSKDLSDLSWSVALDGDVTLQSQILLQEQGYRFYPNFARYAIQILLQQLEGQDVTTEDYYMDTDYNSDPDKFEVKEVLVNISIESAM